MANPTQLLYARTYPVSVEAAFDAVLRAPLEHVFDRWYGTIPPIRGTDEAGGWGTTGQTRIVSLVGGATMREELTDMSRPHTFGYLLTDITGALKPLVSRVGGRWSFEPAGTGVRIVWEWAVRPASAPAALTMPVLGRLWRGYARLGFERIEGLLKLS